MPNQSTDNYQGEESDIVICSLTRSNPQNDIGFMSSPERVNVMLSRARNALIMIGNSNTFVRSRSGKGLWGRLIKMLEEQKHVYPGFPVVCSRHPTKTADLKAVGDFDTFCSGGGCDLPWSVVICNGL